MAGFFAHEWIANLVLKKLKKRQVISRPENISNYFFGAVAPDIRYVTGTNRDVTHKPFGEESLFEALKMSSTSFPFVAGYETHLIADIAWANDEGWMGESIYERYEISPNNEIQKFALYLLVDDFFQAEADSTFPITCAAHLFRANDNKILYELGVKDNSILIYKTLLSQYFREPGFNTFTKMSFIPSNLDEKNIRNILDNKPSITSFLKEFRNISVEKSVALLEEYL